MTNPNIPLVASKPATSAVPVPAASGHSFSFHNFLSAMNPLQYLPVVGTIYRAVTGDVIPEVLRDGGSLVVSGLLGGPIGVVASIVTTIAEKITGIDPEKIVSNQLHPAHSKPPVAAAKELPLPATATAKPPAPLPTPAEPPSPVSALSKLQLAAYGVYTGPSGTLRLGSTSGADVLNTIELDRLGRAAAAYAANQTPPPAATPRSG